jgi:ATP/maltotriose-dependent transcriptional regulator MalT
VTLAIGIAEEIDAALEDRERTSATRVSRLTSVQQQPDALARALAKSRSTWPSDLIVTIDDYHHLVGSGHPEAFISALARILPSRVLITTRSRPDWFEPRQAVYGETVEVGMSELKMTDAEAETVLLASPRRRAAASVARLAGGWPAVIGLAARARRDDFPESLPSELYEFLADDLLASASDATQRILVLLAVSGIADSALARALLGPETARSLEEAVRLGLLSSDGERQIMIHPLFAEFLITRVRRHPRHHLQSLRALSTQLIQRNGWNECLEIAESVPEIDFPIVEILESAVDAFLSSGRIATLRRWVGLARAHEIDAPIVDLAEGEIALRAGDYERALALGARSAEHATAPGRVAGASLLAARAAHLDDQRDVAARWFPRAEAAAASDEIRSAAVYGQFLVAWEEETGEVSELLKRLEATPDKSRAHELRIVQSRVLFAFSQRDVTTALAASRAAQPLLVHPVEPLARLASMNLHAWALLYAGQYADALEAADQACSESEECGVEFAVKHGLLAKASALVGLRRFATAKRIVDQLERSLGAGPDHSVSANLALARARLQVSLGDLDRAADELCRDPGPNQTPALWAEYYATRAMIDAARQIPDASQTWLTLAEGHSNCIEPFAFSAIARAILATNAGERLGVEHYFQLALTTGHHDSIVMGCRACPAMARTLVSEIRHQRILMTIFMESSDATLAKASGMPIPRSTRRSPCLSNRESEVHELLSQGRTNRQISETLFISESTTKVHVRHIYEKLGVHSRVEAARAFPQEGSTAAVRPDPTAVHADRSTRPNDSRAT